MRNVLTLLCLLLFCIVAAREEVEDAIRESYAHVLDSNFDPNVLRTFFDDAIPKSTPDAETKRRFAVLWMVLGSGWTTFESLEHLVAQFSASGDKICVDGWGASLSDFLLYLNGKGHFQGHDVLHHVESFEVASSCKILLDSMMLRRMTDDKGFGEMLAKRAASGDVGFVRPFGYDAVNLFNTHTLAHASFKTKLPVDGGRAPALGEDELDVVIELFTTLPPLFAKLEVTYIYPLNFDFVFGDKAAREELLSTPTDKLVDTRVIPHFHTHASVPTDASWKNIFDMYADDAATQLSIATTLKSMKLFSIHSLGQLCFGIERQLRKQLLQLDPPVRDLTTVQFVIPFAKKSFGLATMLLFMTFEHLSAGKIFDLNRRPNIVSTTATVVVDDFSMSGVTLEDVHDRFEAMNCIPENLFVTPLIQCPQADRIIVKLGEIARDAQRRFQTLPGLQLKLSDFPDAEEWMGKAGYGGYEYLLPTQRTFIAFPYMVPDNSCAFMTHVVGPLLTFRGLGVKRFTPPPPHVDAYWRVLLKDLPLRALPTEVHTFLKPAHDETSGASQPIDITIQRRGLADVATLGSVCDYNSKPPFPVLFNWVLTHDMNFVVGRLRDPFQLRVSHLELAEGAKVYAYGVVAASPGDTLLHVSVFDSSSHLPELHVVLSSLFALQCRSKIVTVREHDPHRDAVLELVRARTDQRDFLSSLWTACGKYDIRFSAERWEPTRDGPPVENTDVCQDIVVDQ